MRFIKVAEQFLVVKNCIGIRTLDYTDKNYNGNYEVSNDSDNYHTAHGLNYHNGPEWVWPSGFYLMSKMNFNDNNEEIFMDLCKRLIPFEIYIQKDKWSGLPELTNKDGAYCQGSCPTQAWSIATLIEALDELSHQTNFLDKYRNMDNKKKKKIKRKKDDDNKYKDNENENDDTKKEVKKKKKIIKKVKKPKKDEEEINEDKQKEENFEVNPKQSVKGKKVKKIVKRVKKPKEEKEEESDD